MRYTIALIVVLAAASATGCQRRNSNDQTRGDAAVGTSGSSGNHDVTRSDKAFVHDMTISNLAEIELAKLAPERSEDNEVKKFAQLMVDDHTNALNSLKSIAAEHDIPVPNDLDGKHSRVRDKIARWHGNDFDRAFVDAAVDEHEDALNSLQSRITEQTLADYNAQMTDRLSGKQRVERAAVVALIPEKSDNPTTMRLNEWAANTYPIVRTHLDAARLLKTAIEKRPNTSR